MVTPGQQRAKAMLQRLANSERIPHALLFLGQTGSGNLALAMDFARLLQCEHPKDGMPCEACNACHKSAQLIHPDIHFSYPTVGTNVVSTHFLKEWRSAYTENPFLDVNTWLMHIGADNKQGNINKEECNAIIKKLTLKTFEGRYKILVMWLPEYLGKEGNRLLKLIEEPPENTIFLLAAENDELILPTVLSRCQIIKSELLSDQEIIDALQTMRNMDSTRAQRIAFLAEGNLNQAIRLTDVAENDDADLLLDWLRKCWKGNGVELVEWTEKFAKLGRENQKHFLLYSLHYFRELVALLATGNPNMRLRPDELASAQNMAKVLNLNQLSQVVELINDNIYYIERNANPKILFLDASIQMNQIFKGVGRTA